MNYADRTYTASMLMYCPGCDAPLATMRTTEAKRVVDLDEMVSQRHLCCEPCRRVFKVTINEMSRSSASQTLLRWRDALRLQAKRLSAAGLEPESAACAEPAVPEGQVA